jgi:hypothetical protein
MRLNLLLAPKNYNFFYQIQDCFMCIVMKNYKMKNLNIYYFSKYDVYSFHHFQNFPILHLRTLSHHKLNIKFTAILHDFMKANYQIASLTLSWNLTSIPFSSYFINNHNISLEIHFIDFSSLKNFRMNSNQYQLHLQ